MKPYFIICLIGVLLLSCNNPKKDIALNSTRDAKPKITCSVEGCQGTYVGPEFVNGSDIAHQFSNQMAYEVGDKLKVLYKSQNYSKVDFSKIKMSTKGMGSGQVVYNLVIPFISVKDKCEAYTSFDHVGGWNHSPALSQRKQQLNPLVIKGNELFISDLKTTPEGLQEYWIQWKHEEVQAECK